MQDGMEFTHLGRKDVGSRKDVGKESESIAFCLSHQAGVSLSGAIACVLLAGLLWGLLGRTAVAQRRVDHTHPLLCLDNRGTVTQIKSLEVEFDVFSGRPNPKWTISGEKAASILRNLGSLREPGDVPTAVSLGYRGFNLKYGSHLVRVFRARIIVLDKKKGAVYLDTLGIEKTLLSEAREQGFGDIVAGLEEP